MEPWHWLLLGLALLAVELFTPGGFYLLFFGIGALVVGGLAATGLPGTSTLPVQIVVFLVTSLTGLVVLRNALVAKFGRRGRAGSGEVDSLGDTVGTALEDLAPGAIGKVELRGASWSARNTGGVALARGQRCAVERVDGLTLWVRLAPDESLAPPPREAVPRKEQLT